MFFSRGKNKIQKPYTLAHMYEAYIKDVEEGSPYDIPYSLYIAVTTAYIKKLVARVYEGFKVKLPYRLGSFQIVKKKMHFLSQIKERRGINWEETNKYGKVIHHHNEHSDGYKYLYHWNRKGGGIKGMGAYRLVPTRTLKRTLAYLIKVERKDYFEVS